MNKDIYFILSIEKFKQQYVLSKGMLKSPHLEDHMKNIGFDQSLYYRSSFEHKCLNNIKKMYQHAGKCDDQENIRDIIYADMLYTPEDVTDDSTILTMKSTTVKKVSAGKSLVFSSKYLMLKRNQQNVVLELQNQNAEP